MVLLASCSTPVESVLNRMKRGDILAPDDIFLALADSDFSEPTETNIELFYYILNNRNDRTEILPFFFTNGLDPLMLYDEQGKSIFQYFDNIDSGIAENKKLIESLINNSDLDEVIFQDRVGDMAFFLAHYDSKMLAAKIINVQSHEMLQAFLNAGFEVLYGKGENYSVRNNDFIRSYLEIEHNVVTHADFVSYAYFTNLAAEKKVKIDMLVDSYEENKDRADYFIAHADKKYLETISSRIIKYCVYHKKKLPFGLHRLS